MCCGVIALVFRCHITGSRPHSSDEASAFRWASGTEISDLTDEAYAIRTATPSASSRPPSATTTENACWTGDPAQLK